eukprot:GFUD01043120.1.p1 GENE.GFUD01043120.1~~GFUD01043120.1.p1  ORF type:complete len:225 (-),score=37.34 GFUD01043120.1:7-681(-)
MTGENIRNVRKFKDKIALLNRKEAETNAQFNQAMQNASEVKNTPHFSVNSKTGDYLYKIRKHCYLKSSGKSSTQVREIAADTEATAISAETTNYVRNALKYLPPMPPCVPLDQSLLLECNNNTDNEEVMPWMARPQHQPIFRQGYLPENYKKWSGGGAIFNQHLRQTPKRDSRPLYPRTDSFWKQKNSISRHGSSCDNVYNGTSVNLREQIVFEQDCYVTELFE